MSHFRKSDGRTESARRRQKAARGEYRVPAQSEMSGVLVCSRGRTRPLFAALMLNLVLTIVSGCAALSGNDDSDGFGLATIRGIRGPLERALNSDDSPLEMGKRYTEAERREARLVREAHDRGDYAGAIKLGKKTAKKFKGSSLGEEAQFFVAESYYALGQYSKAQDGYDQLFEDYPSTRYVEPATRRLFAIARTWLEISEPASRNEIRQVSGEKVLENETQGTSKDPTVIVRILPNFHDRSRPMFDTQGRALQCLKSIWMNDPTGPLADDALMLTASYHQRHGNYVESDRYFQILREEYPDSPHLETAFVLGAHVKQMSYQGPYYEGRDLEGARRLKEQTLQLFPASQQRQQIRKDLDSLYLMEAERAWSRIEYYQKKRNPRAVAIACVQLLSDYPDTSYAREARGILRTIDRSVLRGLPEIESWLDSLPDEEQDRPVPADEGQPRVKSVSDQNSGQIRW